MVKFIYPCRAVNQAIFLFYFELPTNNKNKNKDLQNKNCRQSLEHGIQSCRSISMDRSQHTVYTSPDRTTVGNLLKIIPTTNCNPKASHLLSCCSTKYCIMLQLLLSSITVATKNLYCFFQKSLTWPNIPLVSIPTIVTLSKPSKC